MMTETLQRLFDRELRSLEAQLQAYPNESAIWATPPGISNSAGTLTLHLCGNLQAFIGSQLGGSGYARDRVAEFSRRDVPRDDLLAEIEKTRHVISRTLAEMSPERLDETYPMNFKDTQLATGTFLMHLSTHLAYHLGQIDYHRRMLTESAEPVAAMGILELG